MVINYSVTTTSPVCYSSFSPITVIYDSAHVSSSRHRIDSNIFFIVMNKLYDTGSQTISIADKLKIYNQKAEQ